MLATAFHGCHAVSGRAPLLQLLLIGNPTSTLVGDIEMSSNPGFDLPDGCIWKLVVIPTLHVMVWRS
ncbi:unnamed protein product [Larinioides sclopetarius]|uniref:Uncharacterized protein n=1 Tax=Larinioides sclopetarius TaxID=280406 RepID=A0AAV2AQI2_9ARAC